MKAIFNFHPILDFLDKLAQNNYKAWFDSNRAEYESAREIFNQFVDHLIDELRATDNLQGLTAKECVTRIFRDIRFSRDKSPYHTNFSAIIGPGGKKSVNQSYYVHIEPHDQSLVAGGLYMPSPEQLERFRQAIDQHAATFKCITAKMTLLSSLEKSRASASRPPRKATTATILRSICCSSSR